MCLYRLYTQHCWLSHNKCHVPTAPKTVINLTCLKTSDLICQCGQSHDVKPKQTSLRSCFHIIHKANSSPFQTVLNYNVMIIWWYRGRWWVKASKTGQNFIMAWIISKRRLFLLRAGAHASPVPWEERGTEDRSHFHLDHCLSLSVKGT